MEKVAICCLNTINSPQKPRQGKQVEALLQQNNHNPVSGVFINNL
jgi:hypothetical protein